MALVLTDNKYYAKIAAAIRKVNGLSDKYAPAEMAKAILALGGFVELPDGYTQLEYIKSTGTQYIDTGVIPTNKTVSHFTNFTADSSNTYYNVFLGSQSADNANDSWLFRVNSGGTNFILDIYGSTRVSAAKASNCDIVLDGTGITVNGTKTSFSPSAISAKYPLWIFAANQAGTAFRPGSASFSTLQIYNGETLLRDFVPAKRNSDGVIGLYDLANDAFYTNAGSGTFSGAEI